MIYDSHVHMVDGPADAGAFLESLGRAGVAGAVVISRKPTAAYHYPNPDAGAKRRIDDLMYFTEGHPELYPFFFIDPLEPDAMAQVDYAVHSGMAGFKIICNRCHPGDARMLALLAHIAAYNRPVLFHSGILYDGRNPSSQYNRPAGFDAVFGVEGLRFCLAHIAWPWCDECIALFGKFENSKGKYPQSKTQMYIDLAPGTPPAWRRDALEKLFGFGYDAARYTMFGTDGSANRYDADYCGDILTRDRAILDDLGLGVEVRRQLYFENLERFIDGT